MSGYTCGENRLMSNTRIYRIWAGMKQRCSNTKEKNYYRYGGRGIIVCDDWNKSFTSFYEWSLDNGYNDELTIDRVDNNVGYYPSNCQWITQGKNTAVGKRGKFSSNKSGYTGVSWDKFRNKWFSSIRVNNKNINLGRYTLIIDAVKARIEAEIKYFNEQKTNF